MKSVGCPALFSCAIMFITRISKGSISVFFTFLVTMATISSLAASIVNERKVEKERNETFHAPEIIKSVYLTSWSASTEGFVINTIELAKNTEINAVVIDIKDWSGHVFYDTDVSEVEKYKAEKIFLPDVKKLIERFHKENIAVIARIVVFQDPVLAKAKPDLAIHSKENPNELWLDKKGLTWLDPASEEVWKYNLKIAEDAFSKGFDEVNFDYIRFPSDGNIKDMDFPVWDKKTPKHSVIREFFEYLRKNLSEKKISVDLFGLTTINYDDLGVGQIIEDAFENFDYVCPMVYPSHYSSGFSGFEKPAEHPYEVVFRSMAVANFRLKKLNENRGNSLEVKIRPWLQDFNLGVIYDADMVRKEIEAVYNALGDDFSGFMLWSSSNVYTLEALKGD